MTAALDPRRSPDILEEDRPTAYELLGRTIAPGLAAAIAIYEERGPRCRPCIGRCCYHMSEALSPYCARCRVEQERRHMAQAAGTR